MIYQLPGVGIVVPEDDAFNTWWKQSGETKTRLQTNWALRKRKDDVEDVVQEVYIKLSNVYDMPGKTLTDVQRMRWRVTQNECYNVLRDRNNNHGSIPATQQSQSTDQEQLLTDADYCRYVEQCLDKGVTDKDHLSTTDVVIWKAVRLNDVKPAVVGKLYGLLGVEVARTLKKVDMYLWKRFNAGKLAQEKFSQAWVSNRPKLIDAVDRDAQDAKSQKGPQAANQAKTITQFVALFMRAAGLLDLYLRGDRASKISSVLCDISLHSDWLNAPFATLPTVINDLNRARDYDSKADQYYDEVQLEDANLAQAEAIRLRQRVIERLISDIVPLNGANGND